MPVYPGANQLSLLLQEALQEVRRLFQGPRNDDAVEARELVAHEVVIGDARLQVEVLAVVSGVQATHRYHEAKSIGRGHLAPAPDFRQRDAGVRLHQAGVVRLSRCTEIVDSRCWDDLWHSNRRRMPGCGTDIVDENLSV